MKIITSQSKEKTEPYEIALTYFALGNTELGLMWLREAFDQRELFSSFAKFDPAIPDKEQNPTGKAVVS